MGCIIYVYGIYSFITWSMIEIFSIGVFIYGMIIWYNIIMFMYNRGIYRVYIELWTDELLRIYGIMWIM